MHLLLNRLLFPMGAAGGLGASAGFLVQHFFLPEIDGTLLGGALGACAFLGFYFAKGRHMLAPESDQA